jgi:hypothetical protein
MVASQALCAALTCIASDLLIHSQFKSLIFHEIQDDVRSTVRS